ncbi:MAG: regulator of PEP synthase PpsR (kinase-PPPase family) [Pirellulaceae bacterium]|jgi:regulator of PEP synthase PpsR (kinase-PPPase family)
MPRKGKVRIVVLSGGTGRTGEQVLRSALAQFDDPNVDIVVKAKVHTVKAALRVVDSAVKQKAVLCHTLVDPKVREAVNRECRLRDLNVVDLLGPTLNILTDRLNDAPRNQPGLSHELNKEQFDRMDAVDYTLAHDDGTRVHDLADADVVLVGVSRVSKSVTCFYLASRGLRAANVPIDTVHSTPEVLTQLDPNKVIGLTMNSARLCSVRERRLDRITDRHVNGYADTRQVATDLNHSLRLMRKYGWRYIDVSYKATEEVASEIIEMLSPAAVLV